MVSGPHRQSEHYGEQKKFLALPGFKPRKLRHCMNYINSAPAALLKFKNCSFDPYRIWVRDPWLKLTQHSKNFANGAEENWI
jgi:hypothetical protein